MNSRGRSAFSHGKSLVVIGTIHAVVEIVKINAPLLWIVRRSKPVDVLSVIDARASTEPVFQSIRDQFADQAPSFHNQNRTVPEDWADALGIALRDMK
jgi:hypothetical protein